MEKTSRRGQSNRKWLFVNRTRFDETNFISTKKCEPLCEVTMTIG